MTDNLKRKAAEPQLPETPAKPVYQSMDTVPKDGLMVILASNNNTEAAARWHATRSYNTKTTTWETAGWWKMPLDGQKLPFEPTGWRRVE